VPVWLRYFCFGPLGWAWRSATFGRLQHSEHNIRRSRLRPSRDKELWSCFRDAIASLAA
jgi:hypothetical protein